MEEMKCSMEIQGLLKKHVHGNDDCRKLPHSQGDFDKCSDNILLDNAVLILVVLVSQLATLLEEEDILCRAHCYKQVHVVHVLDQNC